VLGYLYSCAYYAAEAGAPLEIVEVPLPRRSA
jgi:hypothetical protein